MTFQPLGYPFEFVAAMTTKTAKQRLREGMKGWFYPDEAARGWIIGSFLCLWLRANNRFGPLLIARISADGLSTRISGRAGSDLNGTLMFIALFPILTFSTIMAGMAGQLSDKDYLTFGVCALLVTLIIWLAHNDRYEADPLVQFVATSLDVIDRH